MTVTYFYWGGIGLGLLSAASTAFAHAWLKAGNNKLAVQAWVRIFGAALSLPAVLYVGLPPSALWPWLIAAAAVHAVYQAILVWSYSVNDFSAAYPIARGASPVCTAILGVGLLGDQLGLAVLGGIALVSIGIVSLARGNALSLKGLIAALLAGAGTTAYSLVDAQGVRFAPDALTFIAWFYLLDGLSMPLLHFIRAREKALTLLFANRKAGLAAGALSFIAFAPALFAFRLAPVGMVSALRESSILIGLVLGKTMLDEGVDARRITGAFLILAGIVAIVLQPF